MAKAYVLIVIESGTENSVLSNLIKVQNVSQAFGTFGTFGHFGKI